MKQYFVYILKSIGLSRYYIGYCENLQQCLKRHNRGEIRSTRFGITWKIIYYETFDNRNDAYGRERQIKRYKGGKAFKKLIALSSNRGVA